MREDEFGDLLLLAVGVGELRIVVGRHTVSGTTRGGMTLHFVMAVSVSEAATNCARRSFNAETEGLAFDPFLA